MKDIKLCMFTDKGKKQNGTKPNKTDRIDITFDQVIYKGWSIIEGMRFKGDVVEKDYSIEIVTQVCYNIDTLEMYKDGNLEYGGSEEYDIYDKVFNRLLNEYNWNCFDDNSVDIFNKCDELAIEETRLNSDYFSYEFIFDDLEEMISFIRYYDKLDSDYNILEDYYHLIFMKNRDYKNYLKTNHWKEKRKKVLKGAKFKCQLCSNTNNLHVHHNTYKNIGNEKKEDLIVLCDGCHKKFHDK